MPAPEPRVWQRTPVCPECDWRGVPTILEGREQPTCPVPGCKGQLDLDTEAERRSTDRWTLWVLGYAEQPAQVFFTVYDPKHGWVSARDEVPESVSDEIYDEILCDDFRYRGLGWHSREMTYGA